MRLVLRLLVGALTAGFVYAALVFLTLALGGTECDRAECNFVGELAVDDVGRWVLGLTFIASAVVLGAAVAHRMR